MNYKIAWKKEPRLFKDILIILTSVSIFMLATVLETCSYETVDKFSSNDNGTLPASKHRVPSPRSRRTKASIITVTLSPPTSTVRSWPSHEFFQSVLGKPDENITEIIIQPPKTPLISSPSKQSPASIRAATNETSKAIITKVKKRHRDQSRISITPPSIINDTHNMNNKGEEKTRSKLSRDWKLGFDISIVEAENQNKTANKDNEEVVELRDNVRKIPSTVWTKAEIPLRISPYRTKIIRQPENNTTNTNLSRPNLYAKVSGSHNFGEDGKTIWEIRNKTTTYEIKKIPHNDYVDDELANPYGWIDQVDDFTSAPLTNVPKFAKLTWPYNSLKSSTTLPFYIYTKGNTTLKITARPSLSSTTPNTLGIITARPTTLKPVTIKTTTTIMTTTTKSPAFEIKPTPVDDRTTSWTRIPVLIVEQTKKEEKITTQHWGSSGITEPLAPTKPTFTSKPLIVRPETYQQKVTEPITTTTTTTTASPPPTTDIPTEIDPAHDFVEALYSSVSEKPINTQLISTRAPTNIWYKPIINHYSISNLSTSAYYATPATILQDDKPSTEKTVETQGHIKDDVVENDSLEAEYPSSLPSFLFTTKTPFTTGTSYESGSGSSFPSFLFTPTTTTPRPMVTSKLKYKIKTTNTKDKVILFKIWNFHNGKLQLQNEREIPSWILNNYDIKDGTVLNLNELPAEIKDLVKSSIAQNGVGKQERTENRTEREQQFHWQELPSASPDREIISVSSEKSGPVFPSWLTDVSTEWRKPVSLNYVVWNTTSIPSYILKQGTSSEEANNEPSVNYQQYLQEYLQLITTPKSTSVPVADAAESYAAKIKNQEILTKLQHVILTFMSSTPTPPTKDSHPWDQLDETDVMANLAAFAIIMTHLKEQYPDQTPQLFLPPPPNTTPNPYGFTPPPRDHFWAAMYPLLQHLINNKNFTFILPPPPNQQQQTNYQSYNLPTLPPMHYPLTKQPNRVKATEVTRYNDDDYQTTSSPIADVEDEDDDEEEEKSETTEDEEKDDDYDKEVDKNKDLTKTLLLTKAAAAVKGVAVLKGIKKLKKKVKKKLKNKWQNFNPSKLGSIQPGTYDISVDVFGGSLYEIVKNKLTALVAMRYMPVFLVLALGVIPIGIIFVPFLFKFLKLKYLDTPKKKKKKHHSHEHHTKPVYIPVYYAVPQQSPPIAPIYNPGWGWPSYDNSYAGDNTGYHSEDDHYRGITEDIKNIHHHYEPHSGEHGSGWPPAPVPPPHLINSENVHHEEPEHYDDGETPGDKGYNLGFSVGEALGKVQDALPPLSLDNKHDTEVLKILINNKKKMIKKLIKKWKLKEDKASPYVPPYEETQENFETQYGRKAGVAAAAAERRRRRHF